jgi:hypothetical protein
VPLLIKDLGHMTMKKNEEKNTYWQDVENKELDPEFLQSEFNKSELHFDIGTAQKDRRSFLKIMGFSFTTLPLVSCMRIPVKKALPYLSKSDQVVPGVANWYATTMDPMTGSALLVKTREGRPIKIEGNPLSPVTKGGTLPTCQGSILSLYNSYRYKGPQISNVNTSWEEIDGKLRSELDKINESGKEIVLITPTLSSPSTFKVIEKLKRKYKKFSHIVFEPSGMSSILMANKEVFNLPNYPKINIEKANIVVSFSADFLGTWCSPV